MTPEKKAERLVRINFQTLDIPQTLKERPFHKTRRKNEWVYEVGEKGILIRYFVTEEKGFLRLRRTITKFYEDRYPI